ncbi:uncharacterized protein MEPE_00522 [Melanopsichium pennsylvanicum]|uniref:Homeobox domain-containing protein n=2 Tax=Melanopsichium pennsylvanicum TaxID=63383 RepID=A0AAJ4XGC3_9BASI|nr:conserved hypothetical protein [Melanopsichium pennsylvanicum 4]SNX81817.1 uncharacterized protein MEPE_00522 [Melanopsichium pennsylvanicum]
MVSSLTSRPISSIREQQQPQQQASPRLSSIISTPHLTSKSVIGDPSPRISSLSSSDERHSSPFAAASTRSSEYSFDRSSISSFGHRSHSTAITLPPLHDVDHTALIAASDTQKPRLRPPLETPWRERHPSAAMIAADKLGGDTARHASPPPSLRRPASPAGRTSHHSAEWDMHSDRGSPRLAVGRRPGLLPPVATSAVGASLTGAAHSAYAREYGSSPRASYREAGYRDARELSPTGGSGLKRKLSISSDMGARRAALPERVDRNGYPLAPADYPSRAGYPDSAFYRRDCAESTERTYSGSYSRDAAYSGRYVDQRIDDPRYSPRHMHPASPSTSRTAYNRGYDAANPSGHSYPSMSHRPDRYSPGPSPRSPSYASRSALPPVQAPPAHDPYARSAPHASYMRRPQSPPPFAPDTRPVLPPLSSRAPSLRYPPARGAGRYTPPLDASHAERTSPTPEPHAYSEPFYPDRRLYFARERIQDPEIDDYYHGPLGSSVGGKTRFADPYYDPYGSPHAGSYPPPGKGMPGNGAGPLPIPSPSMAPMGVPHPGAARHHDSRHPYPPYNPRDGYLAHDPRDPHGMQHSMGRPMPVPNTHVPPGPSAGIAPPPRRRGKLPKPVTDLLKTWLLEHASHPYPTEDEKRQLCSMTGLTLSQVSNWFINARRRILLPTGANGSPGGSTAAQVKAAFRDDSNSSGPE